MVFYFEASGGFMIYMGRDKFENESLIKYGWDGDVWFHVDDLSSAHVYLRLPEPGPVLRKYRETGNLNHIKEALDDCCALVKANSIEGSKQSTVNVIYTPWSNLKKTSQMTDGQVGFHDRSKVVNMRDVAKSRDLVNRLNKTKKEEYPDLAKQREEQDAKLVRIRKQKAKERAKKEKEEKLRLQKEKDARDYKHLFSNVEEMTLNDQLAKSDDTSAAVDFEDDFM